MMLATCGTTSGSKTEGACSHELLEHTLVGGTQRTRSQILFYTFSMRQRSLGTGFGPTKNMQDDLQANMMNWGSEHLGGFTIFFPAEPARKQSERIKKPRTAAHAAPL